MTVVAAIDVGGTRIKAALVDRSLTVIAQRTDPTPANIGDELGAVARATFDRLLTTCDELGREVRVVGCGLVAPGLVDESNGTGVLSVNLGWRDLQIRDTVEAALDLPTAIGHDVRAGLVAETRLGAARESHNVLFMPIGTGIAGALMLDGRAVSANGQAGELGHLIIEPDGPLCSCGGRGCLETLASAPAIARDYTALATGATRAHTFSAVSGSPRSTGHAVDAEMVARRTTEGDALAVKVWSRAVKALARAVVATVTITGIELVVVGGVLAQSGETLLRPLRAGVAELMTFHRRPEIVSAALGDRAGCLGAACLAWDAR